MKEDYSVIIAGTRDFSDYALLNEKVLKILSQKVEEFNIKIVCGMARGADLLGKKFAEENGFEVVECPADWNKNGKKAGYMRNEEMAKISDALIAFWDSKSPGTGHMIDLANKYKLKIIVINY